MLQILAGTTPKGDLYVVTTNGYVPAPGGQPCMGGGEVRTNGTFLRASRKSDGFALSANGQHPNTGSFRIEAEGTVTAEGQATGTVHITTATCDSGVVAWTGRLVSDQEFAAVLSAFTRQEVQNLFGLAAPAASAVDLAAIIPMTHPTPTATLVPRPISTISPLTAAPTIQPTQAPKQAETSFPPEVGNLLSKLSTPSGIHLYISSTACASDGSCPPSGVVAWYNARGREVVLARQPNSSVVSVTGEVTMSSVAHELCHGHQHQQVLESGWANPNDIQHWLDLPEGRAYTAATGWRLEGSTWTKTGRGIYGQTTPIEDYAVACAVWYLSGPDELKRLYLESTSFAAQWLPR